MDTIPNTAEGSQSKDTDFVDGLLLEEYKLIQGKIDKLGEDKFKVRAWSFTIITGILVGAKLSGGLNTPAAALVIILCITVVCAYHIIELRQQQVSHRLGDRAKKIERLWKEHFPTHRRALPSLATFMIEEESSDRLTGSILGWGNERFQELRTWADEQQKPSRERKSGRSKRKYSFEAWRNRNADNLFYWIQYLILGSLLVWVLRTQQHPTNSNSAQGIVIPVTVGTNSWMITITNAPR